MEIGSWCNSGNEERSDYNQELVPLSVSAGSKITVWRLLWRKIKREKKRNFINRSNSARFSYDPYDYAQNFDEGLMWNDDSDDLSRSFSARFAVPSKGLPVPQQCRISGLIQDRS